MSIEGLQTTTDICIAQKTLQKTNGTTVGQWHWIVITWNNLVDWSCFSFAKRSFRLTCWSIL